VVVPYDLFRSLYRLVGREVVLRPHAISMFAGDTGNVVRVLDWYPAVSFERMVARGVALYEVIALELPPRGAWSRRSVGEMLVVLPERLATRFEPLDTSRQWVVQVVGVEEGTNRRGGPVPLPKVEFRRYR